MSQPYMQCYQCYAILTPGSRFCPGCGTATPDPRAHTSAASPYPAMGNHPPTELVGPGNFPYPTTGNSPLMEFANPNNFPHPSTDTYPPTEPARSSNFPPPPTFSPFTSSPPPPPSSYDPYAAVLPNAQSQPSYAGFQGYGPPAPKKKSSTPFVVVGVIVVLLVALIGSVYAFSKVPGTLTSHGSNQNGGSTFASSQQLNLSTIYASDQMSFTSIQQAAKFNDDVFTTFNDHSNYVRINFKEQQLSKHTSFFSYRGAFHLILPDKTVLSPTQAQSSIAPDQEVVRTNWVDFAANSQVDLGQLILRIGSLDENQMDVPLKTGADLTKYQPKTRTLNKAFQYASIPWKLISATQSLYFEGKQAKSGQVYITVSLTTSNTSQNNLYLYNFVRLKSGDSITSPEYTSNLENFYSIKANTTDIQGSATFLATPSASYTLILLASSNQTFDEQRVSFRV